MELFAGRAEVYIIRPHRPFWVSPIVECPILARPLKYPGATRGATSKDRTVACCIIQGYHTHTCEYVRVFIPEARTNDGDCYDTMRAYVHIFPHSMMMRCFTIDFWLPQVDAFQLVVDIVSKVSILSFDNDTIISYLNYFGNLITVYDNSLTITIR